MREAQASRKTRPPGRQQPFVLRQRGGVIGQMLGDAEVHDRIEFLRGAVFEKVLTYDLAGQLLAIDQAVDVALRLFGNGERGDVDAALSRMLGECAPAGADIEHAPAGLNAARLDRCVELPPDAAVERLVVAFEIAV